MSGLEIRLLGSFELRFGDRLLHPPSTHKARSLLAYLITYRARAHTRERLAELFWPDRPHDRARHSLATALWRIRSTLPSGGFLIITSQAVQFDPESDHWLDTQAFEHHIELARSARLSQAEHSAWRIGLEELRQAVELYRGEFLEGFYDDWCLEERYRLESLYLEALAGLVEGYCAEGMVDAALTYAQRLLACDPLREDIHRRVISLHLEMGNRAAAVQQCNRCRLILHSELGIEPSPETWALCAPLLDDVAAPHFLAGVPELHPSRPQRGRTPFDVTPPPLVGREDELMVLLECWQEAVRGHGCLMMLSGEAGIGKTRLAQELAQSVRWQGAAVLWGRAHQFERGWPPSSLAEALRTLLSSIPMSSLKELPTWVRAEALRLAPELRERCADLHAGALITPGADENQRFDALTELVVQLACWRPFLIVMEDLHRAGESTVAFVHYLARHLAGARILVVGTCRHEEVVDTHPLYSILRRLSRENLAHRLELVRLSVEATERLVGEMSNLGAGIIPLAHRLHQETEGNPFLLLETIRALFEAGLIWLEGDVWRGDWDRLVQQARLPQARGVQEIVRARVARLSEAVQSVLQVAAVAGREFDLAVLRCACRLDEESALELVEELLRRRLIRESDGPAGRDYEFDHHLTREVIYRGLHYRRRQRLHRLVAEAMEAIYGWRGASAAEVAHHFVEAGLPSRCPTLLR